MAKDIEKLTAKEDALRALGWIEVDLTWYSPLGVAFTFEEACKFMGFK